MDTRSTCARHVALLLLAHFALGLPYLGTVPRFYNDEAWEASLGYSLAHDGAMRHSALEGWGGMHVHFVQNQMVHAFLLAPMIRLFGADVASCRFPSLIMGALLLIGVYAVARRWFGPKMALAAALVTLLHPWFFEITRRVRPDIHAAALAYASLAFLIRSRPRENRHALAAGALGGLAALAHPSGLVLTAALWCGYFVWHRSAMTLRLSLAGIGAFALTLAPYVIYVLWATQQQGVDFAVQMAGRKDLIGSGIGELIRGELSRWRHFFQWPLGAPLAALFAGSWVAVWFRTDREDKCIATMIGLFVMALPVTTVNITSRYLVGMVPLFAMLVVRLVQSTVAPASPRATHVRFRRGFGALLGFMYVVTCVGAIGVLFVRLHDADLDRLLTRVADVVEPGARVCGEMILWMEHERFSYGPDPLEPSGGRASDDPERYRRFDYAARFAWTMFTSHGIAAPPASMPDWRPNHALDDICRRFGKRVAAFRDPYYGPVEIYRLAIPPKNGVDTHDDARR